MEHNKSYNTVLHKIKIFFRFCPTISVLHPDPAKLVGKISHLYTPSFVYGQIAPKTVPIHPGLRYMLKGRGPGEGKVINLH